MARKVSKRKAFMTGYSDERAHDATNPRLGTSKQNSWMTSRHFKRDRLKHNDSPNQYGPLTIVEGSKPTTYKATSEGPRKRKQAVKAGVSSERKHQMVAAIVGYADLTE